MTPFTFGQRVALEFSRQKTAAGLGDIAQSVGRSIGGFFGGAGKAPVPVPVPKVAPKPKLDINTAPPSVVGPLAAARGVPVPPSRVSELWEASKSKPPARPPAHRPRMPQPGDGIWQRRFGDDPGASEALQAAGRRYAEAQRNLGRDVSDPAVGFGQATGTPATTWAELQGIKPPRATAQ